MSMIHECRGDNKEFGVDGTKDVTFYFSKSGYTSANDTETEKYGDRHKIERRLVIREKKSFKIVSYDDATFTDPIPVVVGDGTIVPASAIHKEDLDARGLTSMLLRTSEASGTLTEFKIRWRG